MKTTRQFFCSEGCGEIVGRGWPLNCPHCGGEVTVNEQRAEPDEPPKKRRTMREAAHEWAKETLELIQNAR